MSKFEKKFGKYAIENLTLILILCYVAGYIIQLINGSFLNYLTLNPYLILKGQVWRIFTWIVIPPESLGLFTIIMLMFYYSIGTSLERTWGAYRYNVYILSGMLFTVLGSFLCMGYLEFCKAFGSQEMALRAMVFSNTDAMWALFSTYYINMSIFLAFAATFPNVQVLLMFVIPVKIKWMGIIYAVMLLFDVIMSNTMTRFAIIASLLNFVVFFITSRNWSHMSPKQVKRRAEFQKQVKQSTRPQASRHKCTICGRTDEEFPELEFRYCSKCSGNHEYCQDHLFTHEHVK